MTLNSDRLMREQQMRQSMFKQEESEKELEEFIRGINREYDANRKLNLNRFIEMGKALARRKAKCTEIGQWTAALERMKISKQRASEAIRIAALPAATLTLCHSVSDALKCLPAESDKSDTGLTGQVREEKNGHAPKSLEYLATTKVTPTTLDIAGGEITDTVQLREPGEEGDEEEENLGKLISRLEGSLCKKVDAIAKVREVTPKQRDEAKAALKAAMKAMKELNNAPFRKVPDPVASKCKRCHCDVLLVVSTKGNSFYVDAAKRGQFRLEGGRAIHVPKEERKNHAKLYQAHRRVCFGPVRNGKH